MTIPGFPPQIGWSDLPVVAIKIVATWLAVWLTIRLADRWLARFIARVDERTIDRTRLNVLRSLLNALVISAGILITLGILGLTTLVSSMLTAAGVMGIIIGFAVKDVAANLISGLLLLTDRPFSLGDSVAAGSVRGVVEDIALRSTRIRTLEGPVVTVPNSVVAANAITNYTVNPMRQFELVWTLPLDADTDEARQVLLSLAAAEPRLMPSAVPQVLMGEVRSSAYDLRLICQAPNDLWPQIESDLKRAMVARVRARDLAAGLPAQITYTAPAAAAAGIFPQGEDHV